MKRTKRKYTRKATITSEESKSSGIEGESSTIPQVDPVKGIDDDISILPPSLRQQVQFIINYRKRLGLQDDSKERIAKAIKMFRGDRPR